MITHQSSFTAHIDSPVRTFPRPETPLAQIIGDPDYRQAFHRRLQLSNRFVVAFYRMGVLPLLGTGKTTMLLVTRGRKSHRVRRSPVGYVRIGGEIYLISGWGKRANWFKNIQANPEDVRLQVGFRTFPATAQVIQDPAQVRKLAERFVSESPGSAKRLIGWDPTHDCLELSDFSPLMESVLFVRFVPRESQRSA